METVFKLSTLWPNHVDVEITITVKVLSSQLTKIGYSYPASFIPSPYPKGVYSSGRPTNQQAFLRLLTLCCLLTATGNRTFLAGKT
jgi:hypothetical protein